MADNTEMNRIIAFSCSLALVFGAAFVFCIFTRANECSGMCCFML